MASDKHRGKHEKDADGCGASRSLPCEGSRADARADLKDRVRFVGIGVGNTAEQVRDFHDSYDTPFPMLADPEFAAYDTLGTVEGTPYLLLLRRGPDGRLTALAQVGYLPQAEVVVSAIEARQAGAGAHSNRR